MADAIYQTPQLHILGQIQGGAHFQTENLYCQYSFQTGQNWQLLDGTPNGDTFQTEAGHGKFVPFEHPIDLHYNAQSVRGWPKLFLQVWQVDDAKRNSIAGYGITGIPFQQGSYQIDVPCWRPKTEYFDKLIGANPELIHQDILVSTQSRYGFQTETTGKIILQLSIITKDFHLLGVKLGNEQKEL